VPLDVLSRAGCDGEVAQDRIACLQQIKRRIVEGYEVVTDDDQRAVVEQCQPVNRRGVVVVDLVLSPGVTARQPNQLSRRTSLVKRRCNSRA